MKHFTLRLDAETYKKIKSFKNSSRYVRRVIEAIVKKEVMICPTCTGKGYLNKINLDSLENFDDCD